MKTFTHTIPDLSKAKTPRVSLVQQWLRGLRICLLGYLASLIVALPPLIVLKLVDGTVAYYVAAPLVLLVAPILVYRVFHMLGFSLQPLNGMSDKEEHIDG